ncbi:MAG: YggS family pyridoxal phosphate-dependent enzyme [Victivallaceae bacterium]|nr:YggS family pyridoxal phosphate-dependent enzyme [Victivallaceae bacterium]
MSELFEKFKAIQARIAAAAHESKRDPAEVALLAVSKTFPAEMISELYRCGVRSFGESRAEELLAKEEHLPPDIVWHFIGHLQSNKVRKVVKAASVIHSIDSVELLERVDRIASEEGRRPTVLLEVNVSGEASKSGLPPDELDAAADAAAGCANCDFRGLMTMAPAEADERRLAVIFESLAVRRDLLQQRLGVKLPLLSMGMSGDFEVAVRHGSTLVRVGTAIFGGR